MSGLMAWIAQTNSLLLLIAGTVLALGVMAITLFAIKNKRVRTAAVLLGSTLTLCTIGVLLVYAEATLHGATQEHLSRMPISEVIERTFRSHRQSGLSDEDAGSLRDCYIIYFKFGCRDCLETYDELQKFLKENEPEAPVYYISTESEIGRKLLGKYGIAEVPGLVYIYPDGVTFLGKVLYYRSRDVDKAIFDGEAALELYRFRQDVLALEQP